MRFFLPRALEFERRTCFPQRAGKSPTMNVGPRTGVRYNCVSPEREDAVWEVCNLENSVPSSVRRES